MFGVLSLGTVLAVSLLLLQMLRRNGLTAVEVSIFVLSFVLLVPIIISFWMAFFGFVTESRNGDPLALDLSTLADDAGPLPHRTAIVVPIYNENPFRVLASLRACYESLRATGHLSSFDFFVLSDTMDPEIWIDEEVAFDALRNSVADPERLHYRNRARNTGKKAGNIADFCESWGSAYECMIVLDADSVMSGPTVVTLVRAMARDPKIGIIQVPPVLVDSQSLFGRLQQFASRAYGPTWGAGLAWLQGGEGNYYGHNAIIRIAPFVEHCRLPKLPGAPPLGGSILSHDFVEAALMLRGGFRIHLATDLGGSYEESPPTLIDYAARDRRWCQGNLQHARLLGMHGLHLMSRAHMAMGVTSYATAPLWLTLLLLWTVHTVYWQLTPHEYFPRDGALFPVWEISTRFQSTMLLALVFLLLFIPRALAVVSRLRDKHEREGFGGAQNLLFSVAVDWFLSALFAPVLMLEHARFVVGILMRRSVGWDAQPRDERSVGFSEALRRHGVATLMGLVWSVTLMVLAPQLMWWMVPVLGGMVLSIPLSILSSRPDLGRWFRKHGVLLTPEERSPEPVLHQLHESLVHLPPTPERRQGAALERVLGDLALRDLHLSLQSDAAGDNPLVDHQVEGLILKYRLHGAAALSVAEQRLILRKSDAVLALAQQQPASLVH